MKGDSKKFPFQTHSPTRFKQDTAQKSILDQIQQKAKLEFPMKLH